MLLPEHKRPEEQWGERFLNRSPFRTDSHGNIYYLAESPTETSLFSVFKIDVTDPSHLVTTRVTPETDSVYQFAVSSNGHVAYQGSQSRVVSPSNQLFNLPSTTQMVWTSPSGVLHFFGFMNNNWTEISQVDVANDGSVSTSKYGDLPANANGFAVTYFVHEVNGQLYRIEKNGSDSAALIVKLTNTAAQPRTLPGLPISSAKATGASSAHLFGEIRDGAK